jgi:hypothetical protein
MEKIDFLAIQETKMEVIPDSLIYGIWGGQDCDWTYLPAVGNSGGILSIWCKVKASLVFTFVGDGFVEVCLNVVNENRRCFVVNVYAKCNLLDKRRLWGDILMSKGGFGGDLWCVAGDFNSVREPTERRGVRNTSLGGRSGEMTEFNDFLEELELWDLPLIGRRFTWCHPNGVSMSRLDRILISPAWGDLWGDPSVRVLCRDVADHCPLVLRYCSDDWGPKPFRFNNYWLKHKDFKDVVLNAWSSTSVDGWMGHILKVKLKSLKGIIKEWNVKTFGEVELKRRDFIKRILDLDIKSEVAGLDEGEVVERKKLFEDVWRLLKNIDALTFQRSRSKWLKEGDENSRFFHMSMKARKRRNLLKALRTPRGWIEGPVLVRREVVEFFNDHFAIDSWNRPTLDEIVFPQLADNVVEGLTAIFSMKEISEAVLSCDGSKSPGPDGFTFAFIKEFWDVLKVEVCI